MINSGAAKVVMTPELEKALIALYRVDLKDAVIRVGGMAKIWTTGLPPGELQIGTEPAGFGKQTRTAGG